MTKPKPRYRKTRDEALQLRALGRMGHILAQREPNLWYRHKDRLVADAAIRKAEEVLAAEKGDPR